MKTLLLAAVLATAAGCAVRSVPPPPDASRPDEAERAVVLALAWAEVGAPREAVRVLRQAAQTAPRSSARDQVLYWLGRFLVEPESATVDYEQARRAFDQLVREHPDSRYAPEARAWGAVLAAYLARGEALERREQEVAERDQELARRDREIERRDQELARRTQELLRRTQELLRRTRELERLKNLDLEAEQPPRRR